jgi:hypothetical protein
MEKALIHEYFLSETMENQDLETFTNGFLSPSGQVYGGRFGLPPCLILNQAKLPEAYRSILKDFLYGFLQADRSVINDLDQTPVFKIMAS